jgi:hypothetical protein
MQSSHEKYLVQLCLCQIRNTSKKQSIYRGDYRLRITCHYINRKANSSKINLTLVCLAPARQALSHWATSPALVFFKTRLHYVALVSLELAILLPLLLELQGCTPMPSISLVFISIIPQGTKKKDVYIEKKKTLIKI